MKVPSLLVVAAGLGLVSAAPVRVVVVEVHRVSPPDAGFPSAFRFGHAAAGRLPQDFGAHIPAQPEWIKPPHKCGGGFRDRVNHISVMWRKMLGLDTTTEGPHHPPPDFMNFHGPVRVDHSLPHGEGEFRALPVYSAVAHPHSSPPIWANTVDKSIPYRYHQRHQSSFFSRLGRALSVMGPWEGRALSFVLGCGIGVLLRMIFVFGVLAFRARRCARRSIALPAEEVVLVVEAPERLDEKTPVPVQAITPTPAST